MQGMIFVTAVEGQPLITAHTANQICTCQTKGQWTEVSAKKPLLSTDEYNVGMLGVNKPDETHRIMPCVHEVCMLVEKTVHSVHWHSSNEQLYALQAASRMLELSISLPLHQFTFRQIQSSNSLDLMIYILWTPIPSLILARKMHLRVFKHKPKRTDTCSNCCVLRKSCAR